MSCARFLSLGVLAASLALAAEARSAPAIVVRGDADCPTADMIQAASRAPDQWPWQTVTLDVSNDRLLLTLDDATDVQRKIPADPDCATRAKTVALVLALWSGELTSRPTDAAVLTVATPPPPPKEKPSHVFELDAGPFYSLIWGHAAGAWLGVGRTPRAGGLGIRLVAAYQAAENLALEGGTNHLLRFLVGAAATLHRQWTYVFGSADLGVLGAFTRASGDGYAANLSDHTLNFGAFADLRVGLRLGRSHLWAGCRGVRLFHDETVKLDSSSPGIADHSALSAWDLQLGLGLGVRFE